MRVSGWTLHRVLNSLQLVGFHSSHLNLGGLPGTSILLGTGGATWVAVTHLAVNFTTGPTPVTLDWHLGGGKAPSSLCSLHIFHKISAKLAVTQSTEFSP